MGIVAKSACGLAFLLLSSRLTLAQSLEAPKISGFALYAERSIKIGERSHVEHGDVGVRTAVAPAEEGPAQLQLDGRAKCRKAYSPSISLHDDAEASGIWTDSLQSVEDANTGPFSEFPAAVMPPLPLALASGTGADVSVEEGKTRSLSPGAYGTVTLERRSTLRLAAGRYSFAGVRMGRRSKLLGERGGVDVRITGGLQMAEEAEIEPHWNGAQAKDFTLSIAGSDPVTINHRTIQTTVVRLARKARVHALLAAPHGTLWIAEGSSAKGAFAAFDIVLGDHVKVELESGFPLSAPSQQGSQTLHGYFAVEPDPSVTPPVGPVPVDTKVALAIGLPVRDPAGLRKFIQQVSDPRNPLYRRFVSQAQFYATYSPSTSDYQSVQDWASRSGFTIQAAFPNRLLLSVTATAAQIEQALYVNLVYRLRQDGSKFVTVDRDPSLDLPVSILHISGFNDDVLPHPAAVNGTGFCPGRQCGTTLRAADLRNAYLGVGSSCQALDGTGQVIGLVEATTFNEDDIRDYFALQMPLLHPTFFPSIVAREGGNPVTNADIEVAADVELAQGMAPNARILVFQGSAGITGYLDDILHVMATSNPPLTVAGCSLGFGGSANSQQALDEMAAQGVSFFTSSGDRGDVGDPGYNVDMDSQTLVGGTLLSTNPLTSPFPSPVYPAPPDLYYAGETTWNEQSLGITGGGVMDGGINFRGGVPIPEYQKAVSMAANGGSTIWRNYPDVAMVADNVEFIFTRRMATAPGTSLGPPLWAGFIALANQANQNNGGPGLSGFLNTTIYDIGLTSGQSNDLYSVCFHDINDGGTNATGSRRGYRTVAGYDLTTGWGSPTCGLIQQLSTATPLTPNQPLRFIRLRFSTGDDDLRNNHCCGCGGTGLTADVLLQNGTSFPLTLKPTGTDERWDNNTTTSPIDFPIPGAVTLTQSQGIRGITLTIHESYSAGCTADNWDVKAIEVSLFNPPAPPNEQVCQLHLHDIANLQDGHIGLIRFSESAGSSGSGPTATFLVTDPRNHCP